MVRRYRLVIVAVIALIIGAGFGAVVAGGNEGASDPALSETTTTTEAAECRAALQLADEALHASAQAVAIARLRADAADDRGAPPPEAVASAVGSADAARQAYERARSGC
jgi:hypothetical protein